MSPTKLTPEVFGDLCAAEFSKVRPASSPPHDTIFNVAQRYKVKAVINGITVEEWTKMKAEDADDDADERLRIDVAGVGTLYLKWVDFRVLEPYKPRNPPTKN